MMKKRIFVLTLVVVMLALCVGCSIPGTKIPEHFTYYQLNRVRDIDGNLVTITNAAAFDSYRAPDGKEYTAEADGKIFVVTADVVLLEGWEISPSSYMTKIQSGKGAWYTLCDPIVEVSAEGNTTITLLYSMKAGEFSGFLDDYLLELKLKSGKRETFRWFLLHDYPTIYPLNYPWMRYEESISLTEVLSVDHYQAPDGTEYKAEDGGTLAVLRFRADLTDWRISMKSHLFKSSAEDHYPLCAPFIESDDGGESNHVLIFSLGKDDFYGDPESYLLMLEMESDTDSRTQRFYLKDDVK